MAAVDGHAELVGHPAEQRLRSLFDLFHTDPVAGGTFIPPDPPDRDCDCEWGQHSHMNDAVAILDGHVECPFCRGRTQPDRTQ